MSDIFISYASEDRSRVRLLAEALSSVGWSVWWDRQIPAGRTFDQVIIEALADARCVVVVWSRDSVDSSWVREEADEGRKRGVLIPVLIDEVSPPLGFGRIQAAPMAAWNGVPEAEAFQKLAADIARVIGAPPGLTSAGHPTTAAAQRVIPRPAPRISFHGRTVSLLLAAAFGIVLLLLAPVLYRTGRSSGDREPPPPPPPLATGLRLTAVLDDGGKPLARGVAFDVFTAAPDHEGRRKRITGSSHPYASAWFPLPAGRYFVTAAYGNASANVEVEVTSAGVTPQILNLRAGFLQLSTVLADGGDALSGVAYEIYSAVPDAEGYRKRVTGSSHQYDAAARFLLPAGRYFVTAGYGSASANVEVTVTPAAVTQQIFNLRAGILRLNAVLADGREPLADGVAYEVYTATPDAEGNRKRVARSNQSSGPPRFPLPSGRYFVTAAHSGGNASAETTIIAGRTQDLQLRIMTVTKR